jgi:hypothetical protein
VSGETDVGGLVGKNADGSVQASYWDTDASGQDSASGTEEGDLNGAFPTSKAGLRGLDGDTSQWAPSNLPAENPEFWFCDSDGSGEVEAGEQTDGNFAWDMGVSSELPAIGCAPGGASRQRT